MKTNKKVYVIAEIGSNHDGNLNQAKLMIEKAKEAGANAVKFQTFKAEKLLNPFVFQEKDLKENWVYQELKKVEINEEFHQEVQKKCQQLGIDFLSSPFDEDSLALTARYCHAIKIASSEVPNLPLLRKVGQYQKPVILSTGISNLGEVEQGISALIFGGVTQLSLLHCVSLYPLNPENANLKVITTLQKAFGLDVGFSDHSLDDSLALTAVALGASIIEKHVTLKREDRIFDHSHSMEFSDLQKMIENIRKIEVALGDGIKKMSAQELEIKKGSNKSFFAAKDLKKGDVLTLENLKCVRPYLGIPAKYQEIVLGKKTNQDIQANYPLLWEHIQ